MEDNLYTSDITSGETSGVTSSTTSGDTSSITSGDTSIEISGDTSGVTSGETSGDTSGGTSGETSGETSGYTYEVKMMKYLSLSLIKQHLQINEDYHNDDFYLDMLGGVVECAVEKVIDDDLSELASQNDGILPLPLQQACLLLLGEYYSNREANAYGISVNQIPLSFTYLTDLYRRYGSDSTSTTSSTMLSELNRQVQELTAYMQFDNNRTIEGSNGVTVVTTDSGQTTTIAVDIIDEGEY